MADYKKMYFDLLYSTERAIRVLIEAQQQCEESYLEDENPVLNILDGKLVEGVEPSSMEVFDDD